MYLAMIWIPLCCKEKSCALVKKKEQGLNVAGSSAPADYIFDRLPLPLNKSFIYMVN